MNVPNLFQITADKTQDFFIWIDPSNFLVKHQIQTVGSFFSGGNLEKRETNLMFIPNPKFKGDIAPFQFNLMNKYITEYNMELCREQFFLLYPSRLNAIFLFKTEDEAKKYGDRHKNHVCGRLLRKVKSSGLCIYSEHDSSWVDFMRLGHCMDNNSINDCCKSYWQGIKVEDSELQSMGQNWSQSPIIEVLFCERIEFYNRTLSEP